MTTTAVPPRNPRTRTVQSTLTVLLLATLLVLAIAVCAAVIRFALPNEPALFAGMIEDFLWDQPVYVPLRSDLGVYLVRDGDKIVALDAASTTSGCRIGWLEDQEHFRDPCCGASWARDGTPHKTHYADLQPLRRYEVIVSEAEEVFVYPWRNQVVSSTDPC